MASSSRKSTKGRGGTFSSKGGYSVTGKVAASRGSEDNGDSSSFGLGSSEPLGDILGRPTIDPWYRNGERFPSVPATTTGGLGVVGYQRRRRTRCGLDSNFPRNPRLANTEE